MSNLFTNTKRKLFQAHGDRVRSVAAGENPIPVNVEIDLSNRCQLGCEWCHFKHTHTRGPLASHENHSVGDLLDTRLAKSIIGQLKGVGVRSVTWTGGGEPTLHPDYVDILNESAKYDLDQGIYSNGCHITAESAAELTRSCNWIYVSLDCTTAEEYQQVKRSHLFNSACRGIRHLTRLSGHGTAIIGVGFLIGEDNWMRYPDMVRLANELEADYVQFRPAIMFDNNDPGVVSDRHRPQLDSWLWKFLEFDFSHRGNMAIEIDKDRFLDYYKWSGHGYTRCLWSSMQTVITPDGRVWTCCNKRGYEGESLGDLNRKTFKEIWSERAATARVNDKCRIMCRGHAGNKILHDILSPTPHANFI